MEVIKTEIEGVMVIEPRVFGDDRGYFFESFNEKEFTEKVGNVRFVQDNESKSRYGVVRGLHFQKGEFAQAKLVRVVSGAVLDVAVDLRPVLDVAVDLRPGSPTYGKYHAEELTGENHRMMFIPRGFAHGFSVLSEEVVFQYKCDNLYCPAAEGAVAWNDPTLAIDWRVPEEDMILSEKDKHHPFLYE